VPVTEVLGTHVLVPEATSQQPPPPEEPCSTPQQEPSAVHSTTTSEVESLMHHRERRASLVNPVFTDQEFEALRTVDAHLGAARMGLKEAEDILAASLQVN
jgi:hypothetical protein